MAPVTVRNVDARGRVTIGQEFAMQQVIITRLDDGFKITPAKTVPQNEAWLYENPKALAAVNEGLAQAAAGELSDGPDLAAGSAFADMIEDD